MEALNLIPLLDESLPVETIEPLREASFDEKLRSAIDVIKGILRQGKRCVVAVSFGKDSSVTLAITLMAMRDLKGEGFAVPELHVMNSDTLENPVVHSYSKGEIRKLKQYAAAEDLPIRVWVCSPSMSNNYLVNIIGGRTVASLPDTSAKCQQSMKAVPLERTKKAIAKQIKAELGDDYSPDKLITLIGTRRDESAVRGRAMAARGESAVSAVNLGAEKGLHNWVLSPIADFTSLDVFEFIGNVTSERISTYSDFKELVELYRDSAGGECMVNLMLSGQGENKTACGARTGCWLCHRVSQDRSMENMLAEENGKYSWMKPLSDFRNYLGSRHYDPAARNFIARTVNPKTGAIQIAPNSYSPDFCLELLQYALSIDADEQEWAMNTGNKPRFTLLGLQEVLAIDALWARYGYQLPFQATKQYREIFEEGKRYRVPSALVQYDRSGLDFRAEIQVPFADPFYNDMFSGLRDLDAAMVGAERLVEKADGHVYSEINTDVEFGIDEEGAWLFFDLELDRILNEYGPSSGCAPSAAIHVMARYGFLLIKKGGESEWDRMLRVGNQIHRHQLRELLNKPASLVRRLNEIYAAANDTQVSSAEYPARCNPGTAQLALSL